MPTYSTDRRGLLKILGAIGATCAHPAPGNELFGQTDHGHSPAPPAVDAPRFFKDRDYATISRIADLIVPRTDTPGAVDAGVPEYIDRVIAANMEQQALAADGLRWLDAEAGGRFLDLPEAKQLAILRPLCDAVDNRQLSARNVRFFALMKNLTADGYFTSRAGLIEQLGYKGNTVMTEFPDCPHEH